jgi:diguanylate cyclase
MRYRESRERSAEVFRLVLAQMAQHPAAFNPTTFAVWYEHLAGVNAVLSRALEQAVAGKEPLDDERIAALFARHVADLDETTTTRIREEFQNLMSRMAESAASTGAAADEYGKTLDGLHRTLAAAPAATTVDPLLPQIAQAAVQTGTMRASMAQLEQQVTASRQEIERLRQDLDQAREDAVTDPLTHLLNRKGFQHFLESLVQAPPGGGAAPGLIMIDVDHFKQVNDQHGHTMGDRVLAGLGEVLRAVVPRQVGWSARYGGEEFAVLLSATTGERATQLADALRDRIAAMKLRNRQTNEVVLTVTVSTGVALHRPGEDSTGFVARADKALYRSKQTGRNRTSLAP